MVGYRQEGRQGAPGAAAAAVGERKGLQIGRGSVDVPAVALRPDVRHRRVARSGHMPPRGAFFLRFTFCASFFCRRCELLLSTPAGEMSSLRDARDRFGALYRSTKILVPARERIIYPLIPCHRS